MIAAMNRIGFTTLVFGITLLAGCGGGGPAPQSQEELDKAKTYVKSALDVWKSGGSAEKLKSLSPAIEIADHEWKAGARLTQYDIQKVEGNQKENTRCWVKLTVLTKGKSTDREVVYDVRVADKIVIGRDPFN